MIGRTSILQAVLPVTRSCLHNAAAAAAPRFIRVTWKYVADKIASPQISSVLRNMPVPLFWSYGCQSHCLHDYFQVVHTTKQ
jgi:hypothetical protein